MKNSALIIFTRNPILGKVKTRLAKTIGEHKALEVYQELLRHTKKEVLNLDCDKFIFYDQFVDTNDLWENSIFLKKLQLGNDLGEKMFQAFQTIFELKYENAILIGSDLFDLKTNIVKKAFESFDAHDTVLGPAEDGGYYLIGMKKPISTLFINKEWGTNSVLEKTLNDLKPFTTFFAPICNDIDTYEDLQKSGHKIIR